MNDCNFVEQSISLFFFSVKNCYLTLLTSVETYKLLSLEFLSNRPDILKKISKTSFNFNVYKNNCLFFMLIIHYILD